MFLEEVQECIGVALVSYLLMLGATIAAHRNLMGWTPPDGLYGKVEVLKHH